MLKSRDIDDGIHFQVQTIQWPIARVETSPLIRSETFFVKIFSIFGIWLEFSAILVSYFLIKFSKELLPFKWKKRFCSTKKFKQLIQEFIFLATKTGTKITNLSERVRIKSSLGYNLNDNLTFNELINSFVVEYSILFHKIVSLEGMYN